MRNIQLQTKREFDMPVVAVVIAIIFTIISIIACFYVDSLTAFPNERKGYYLGTLIAIGLSAYSSHLYVWGREVTYGPIDME